MRLILVFAITLSKISQVGENGAGKTTLLKIITGHLQPTGGLIHPHRGLRLGYFAQHHVDQLDMSVNCVELLQNAYPGKPIEEYRRVLGSFGVSGDLAMQVVASLSGGQKSRVALAKMCMGRPNFLVLDEPTNHLDIETIEALGKAINKYSVSLSRILLQDSPQENDFLFFIGWCDSGFPRRASHPDDLQRAVGLRRRNCS